MKTVSGMITSCAQLVKAYYVQLTEGCDKLDCQEPECLKCPYFRYDFYDPNDVAVQALLLAKEHPHDPHLCMGVNPLKIDSSLSARVKVIDESLRKLIKGKNPDDNTLLAVTDAFSDYRLFSCILRTNEKRLSMDNIALDDESVSDIIRMASQYGWFFEQAQGKFCEMVASVVLEQCSNTFLHIRALFLVMLFEVFFNYRTVDSVFVLIVSHFSELTNRVVELMKKYLMKLPSLIEQCHLVVKLSIDKFVEKHGEERNIGEDPIVYQIAKFVDFLARVSQSANMTLDWTNDSFTALFDVDLEWARHNHDQPSIIDFPSVLSLDFKISTYVGSLPIKDHRRVNTITIRRGHLVDDAIAMFREISMDNLNNKIVIKFLGEDGVDEGGVTREFFHLLFSSLLSPDYGMFELIDNKFYWFKQVTIEQPETFELIGSIISLAIYHSIILPIRFPLLFYKKLFGRKIEMEDIREVQPDLVRSFEQMKEMANNREDISSLCLTFSVSVDNFGSHREIDLVGEGRTIEVNNENYQIYIDSYIEWYAYDSIRIQFDAFERGFRRLCNPELLKIFSPHEVDVLVSGEEVYDWEELKTFCQYSDGFTQNSRQVKWFWEVFGSFSLADKKKWLQFVTGSDRAPCGGLKELQITIQRSTNTDHWPVAHSCFNIFVLPEYSSKEILKENVHRAIQYAEGFGIK